MQEVFERRRQLISMLPMSLVAACSWPRFFELGWDEEVQLHDGRVVLVGVKYEYERQSTGFSFDRYGRSLLRNSTLTFEAGPNRTITQLFVNQRPLALDTSGDEWFVVLQRRAIQAVQDWGAVQNGNGQYTAHLVNNSFKPISIDQLPTWLSRANLLMDNAPLRELASLNKTRVSLGEKLHYIQKYPLSPSLRYFERPSTNSDNKKQ